MAYFAHTVCLDCDGCQTPRCGCALHACECAEYDADELGLDPEDDYDGCCQDD